LREEFGNDAEFVDALYQDDDVMTENLGQHFAVAAIEMDGFFPAATATSGMIGFGWDIRLASRVLNRFEIVQRYRLYRQILPASCNAARLG
jgi:hypothetical protein